MEDYSIESELVDLKRAQKSLERSSVIDIIFNIAIGISLGYWVFSSISAAILFGFLAWTLSIILSEIRRSRVEVQLQILKAVKSLDQYR